MKLFRKRPSPLDPQNAAHDAIAAGSVTASLAYVRSFAAGDVTGNIYWQERAQAVLLAHLMDAR